MDIRTQFLALVGALIVTPLVAAPPPPPAPPTDGASASGQARTSAETQPRDQQSGRPDTTASASTEDNVQLRGALHEAFARPVSHDPIRQPVIRKAPPKPIEEVPPEYRPEGENVIWVPGYWSYEDSEDEFLWISGLWRDVPPGRRWVPGYWSEAGDGHLWTPGEWIGVKQNSMTYLAEPPRSQERGPSSDAPSADHFWLPGCWEYRDDDYAWRPGYWAPHQQDWVWVPAHYDWTPNGYVYCDGYWDYDIDRRGIVYAPYRYQGRHVTNYTPQTALDVPHLLLHLFVGNRTGNYYFGDYYGRDNYQPWYNYHSSRSGYDPIFSYNSWRNGADYQNRLTGWNTYFTRHEDFRPRRTLAAQQQFLSRYTNQQVAAQINIARAITGAVGSELFGRRVVDVSRSDRDSAIRTAGALLSLADQRLNVESRGRGRASVGNGNRNSANVQGRGNVRVNSLTLPEIARTIARDARSTGANTSNLPALPRVANGNNRGRNTGNRSGRDTANGISQSNIKSQRPVKDAVGKSVSSTLGVKNRKKPKKGKSSGLIPSVLGLK